MGGEMVEGEENAEGRGRDRWSLTVFRAKPEQRVDLEARVQTPAFPGLSLQPQHCERCPEWYATEIPHPPGRGDTLHRRAELAALLAISWSPQASLAVPSIPGFCVTDNSGAGMPLWIGVREKT